MKIYFLVLSRMVARQSYPAILIVLFIVGAILLVIPNKEKFVTLTGAKSNKAKGMPCEFDAECASDICLHYNSPEGLQHTCS